MYLRVRVDQFSNCLVQQQVQITPSSLRPPFLSLSLLVDDILILLSLQATVILVDTGETRVVSCHHLHVLPTAVTLTSVPPLALPCRLGGVCSTYMGDLGKWYFLDSQLLWKYLMKKKVRLYMYSVCFLALISELLKMKMLCTDLIIHQQWHLDSCFGSTQHTLR